MKEGSKIHEDKLQETVQKLTEKGWRVAKLRGRSPDAVACKDGKLVAVEVLGVSYNHKKKRWHKSWTITEKRTNYSMFDDVFIVKYKKHSTPVRRGRGIFHMENVERSGYKS